MAPDCGAVRIGNCSGFYGDRLSAMREMLTGGELDYLTGDYLAELTMLILGRDRMKNPDRGYAKTFLAQLEDCLGLAHDRGVRIVTNAGGLNPAGLANAVRALAARLGIPAQVAHVEGDDLQPRAAELGLGTPLTANAYLGAWGIVDCFERGADVVVTGRVTDASVVVGAAAAHFGWGRTDYHRLAGAEETASALLTCVARDPDPANVGRQFSSAAVELALASYPGFTATAPPGDGQVYGVFTPGYVDAGKVAHIAVHADGTRTEIPCATETLELAPAHPPALPDPLPAGPTRRVPLGLIAGARSGDKGGSANVGVWVRTDEQWRWLAHTLTVELLKELLPETAGLVVTRHVLPNLRALNFVIEAILGQGVAYQARFDPQAKGLGEWLRSRHVEIPETLL